MHDEGAGLRGRRARKSVLEAGFDLQVPVAIRSEKIRRRVVRRDLEERCVVLDIGSEAALMRDDPAITRSSA